MVKVKYKAYLYKASKSLPVKFTIDPLSLATIAFRIHAGACILYFKKVAGLRQSASLWYKRGLQGGLENSKISGVGTNFGLLVYVVPGPNKQRALKPSTHLS